MSNFMKIHPMRAELFHADRLTKMDGQVDRQSGRQAGRQADRQTDRQTDITKLIVTFHNFADVPNNNLSGNCS
jgi:hypothetical protein